MDINGIIAWMFSWVFSISGNPGSLGHPYGCKPCNKYKPERSGPQRMHVMVGSFCIIWITCGMSCLSMLLIWTKSFIRAPGQMTLANTLLPVRFVTARSYAVRTAQSMLQFMCFVVDVQCIGLDSCESHRIATNSTEWFVSLFRCVPFAMITWWWGWRVWNWQVIVPLSVASALGSFIYCRGFNCSMPVDAMHLFKSLCRALLLLSIFVSQSLSYQWCRDCIWWPDCGVDLCLCKWVFFLKFVLECFLVIRIVYYVFVCTVHDGLDCVWAGNWADGGEVHFGPGLCLHWHLLHIVSRIQAGVSDMFVYSLMYLMHFNAMCCNWLLDLSVHYFTFYMKMGLYTCQFLYICKAVSWLQCNAVPCN